MKQNFRQEWAVVNLAVCPHTFRAWHKTEDSAKKEAERLAIQNPGSRFAVLEFKGSAFQEVKPSIWREAEPHDIPF